jgi:isocitrate dehydrogenase
MKQVFEEASHDYPDIQAQHIIVDNCAHQLVRFPEKFETIVTTNMNGDILSDLGSGLVGGLGFAPGGNFGQDIAIFEAVHGSAPKYTGRNVINPTALILSSVMMLRYLGEFEPARAVEQALFVTLGADHISTRDVIGDEKGVSTTAFTNAVIKNLGKTFEASKVRDYKPIGIPTLREEKTPHSRGVGGLDVYIETRAKPEQIGKTLKEAIHGQPFTLRTIASRGVKVYPSSGTAPDTGDHLCCRFLWQGEHSPTHNDIVALLTCIDPHYPWMHIEKLNVFDGQPSFSKLQGED